MSQLLLNRPRGTIEIIDAAFAVLRAHYGTLVTTTMLLIAPAIVLRLFLPQDIAWLSRIPESLLGAVAGGAVIAMVGAWLQGGDMTMGEGIRRALRKLPTLIAINIITTLGIFVGLLLLIVPGLILFAKWFAAPVAAMIEDKDSSDALGRASDLAEGQTRRLIGALVVTVVIFLVVTMVLAFGVGMAFGGVEVETGPAGAAQLLVGALIQPILPVVTTLLYFDLRVRKEAFDLELLARELPPAPDGSAAVAR